MYVINRYFTRSRVICSVFVYGVLFLFPYRVFSQYQLDSVWHRTDSVETLHIQHYDPSLMQLDLLKLQRTNTSPLSPLEKTWIQYDGFDNEVLRVDSRWNMETAFWQDTQKSARSYDAENRLTSYASYEWKDTLWAGTEKTTYDYIGRQEVTSIEFVGKGAQWLPTKKTESQFNSENDEVSRISYDWDSLAGDWVYKQKDTYSYHRRSLLSESIRHVWDNDSWVDDEKIIYEYNTPDSVSLTDQYTYEGTPDGWKNTQRTVISYYGSARRNEIYAWSDEEQAWERETLSESYFDRHGRETDFLYKSARYQVHFQRMTIFDDQGRITLSQEIGYNGDKHAFGVQTLFEFDEEGNTVRQQDKFLDVEHGRWILGEERHYHYDKSIPLRGADGSALLDKGYLGTANIVSNKHAVKEVKTYQVIDDERVLKEHIAYFYSQMP